MAKEVNVLKIDVPQESGRGWRRTDTEVSTQELGDSWQEDVSRGARYVLQETLVKASDPHYERHRTIGCSGIVHDVRAASLKALFVCFRGC